MRVRQPIVSVLGHVDHGKTTLLDYMRGTSVASREPGFITQHIGATEIPIKTIKEICGPLFQDEKIKVPGLLFIDTPGHHAFTSLRVRGGALADMAVLVVDVIEGLMPQTIESLYILRRHKTPFLIAANKIDRVDGWSGCKDMPFMDAISLQGDHAIERLEKRIYDLIGQLYDHGFTAERYDRITDFSRTLAIVPTSAKFGIGVSDLLLVLIGLAQRFLAERLGDEAGPAEGTVLEVKEERGLGTTIDAIIYRGVMKRGDTIAVGGIDEPVITKVKALLRPKELEEIRDPRYRFRSVSEVSAAAGIKISAPDLDDVVAGSPIKVVTDDLNPSDLQALVFSDRFTRGDEGIFVKADTLGSLEAILFELERKSHDVARMGIGNVSKSEVMEVSTFSDPLRRVILAFNVRTLPEVKDLLQKADVHVIEGNVIYKLIDDFEDWLEKRKTEMEKKSRMEICYPAMFRILPGYVFRTSRPAIVGVRVLVGRLTPNRSILREDGQVVGRIKSMRYGDKILNEARAGEEVAIAIEGVTMGRQIKEDDVLYLDVPEGHVKRLKECGLNQDEQKVLERVIQIKRRFDPFWGA